MEEDDIDIDLDEPFESPHGDPFPPVEFTDAGPPRPVPFISRLAAILLDWIVLMCASAVIGFFLGLLRETVSRPIPLFDVMPVVLVLFITLADVAFAASPGKSMMGQVIRRPDGTPAPLRRLLLRWAIKCGPLILLGLTAIIRILVFLLFSPPTVQWVTSVAEAAAGIWILALLVGLLAVLHPRRLAFHDWLAGTAVFAHEVIRPLPGDNARGFEVTPLPVVPAGDFGGPPPLPPAATVETSDHPV